MLGLIFKGCLVFEETPVVLSLSTCLLRSSYPFWLLPHSMRPVGVYSPHPYSTVTRWEMASTEWGWARGLIQGLVRLQEAPTLAGIGAS
ncbi:hypothetical protein LOAG_06148 [Loa loa]|uniref:Uncharacterized protein n=1 Tax=Loa loa TaxID=7209 RepID=A0A1S0TYP3_LOALO|nr:hypothetical protein LOAG_06148 [Loa loa]EFO22338.1 hypothetical protein LOAG_06148 [Loa loa]